MYLKRSIALPRCRTRRKYDILGKRRFVHDNVLAVCCGLVVPIARVRL